MKRLILILSLVAGVLSTATAAIEIEAGKAYIIKYTGNSKYLHTPGKAGMFIDYCENAAEAMQVLLGYDQEENAYSMFSPNVGAFIGMDAEGFLEASAEPFCWQLLGSNDRMAIRSTVETGWGDTYLVDFGSPSVMSTDPEAVWQLEEAPIPEGVHCVDLNVNANRNCYDLQGRRISSAVRGLMIQQGRKVFK